VAATSRLVDQLALMAAEFPSETAFVDLGSDSTVTFAEWDVTANRLARGFRAVGVEVGDRVALDVSGGRSKEWIITYAAIHRAGAVAVPINTRLVSRERRDLLVHGEVSLVVVDAETGPTMRAALAGEGLAAGVEARSGWASEARAGGGFAGGVTSVRLVVELDAPSAAGSDAAAGSGASEGSGAFGGAAFGVPTWSWTSMLDPDGSAVEAVADDDDISDIVYTSGTTGRPKGVVVRHSNASMLPNGVPTWTGDGWLTCSPLFTFAGLTAVYTPMKLGMTALYLPRFDPGVWLRLVERRRPTMVFLVPAMAELLLAHPDFPSADLSSIGLCAVGSAPLAPEVQRRLQGAMPAAAVSNAYGMTEAGPAYTVLPKEEAVRRLGSVGRPLPPAEFFVVDTDGCRLGADQVGELVINLPGRSREYYRDPEATAGSWQGDGLHTGDLARVDADGYVYVVGRAKEVIIRGGNNVHATDVEAVIHEHPDVQEVVVAGVPHPVLGEDVAAWVVPRPGRPLAPVDIWAFAAERLADYKVPRRVAIVAELPRNATGKVVKSELTVPEVVAESIDG
jgi:acyl-CoA synthetase (AMP-forming)/AMP-acid ligase II